MLFVSSEHNDLTSWPADRRTLASKLFSFSSDNLRKDNFHNHIFGVDRKNEIDIVVLEVLLPVIKEE